MNVSRKAINWHRIYIIAIFLFFCLYYMKIHPLLLADPDDWTYISNIRNAVPIWGDWNPAKVFPETFMGLCGGFAAFVLTPLIGDYVYSMTVMYAIIVSVFIAIYLYAFDILIKKLFALSDYQVVFVSWVFLASHFLVFKTQESNNIYMLTAIDLNCFMNYLVPFLLCAALGFLFIAYDIPKLFEENNRYITKGFIILFLYLSIFSNMVDSILLISVVLFRFIIDFYSFFNNNSKNLSLFIKKYPIYIFIFGLEIINLVFEANGGRADNLEFDFRTQFYETIEDVKTILKMINRKFLFIAILTVLISLLICLFRDKNKDKKDRYKYIKLLAFYACCFFLCSSYAFLLMTRVGLHKILRAENIAIFFIYAAVIFSFSVAYIIKSYSRTIILLPLISYIVFFAVISGNGHVYKRSYSNGGDFKYKLEADRDYVNQFIEADKAGLTELELHVTSSDSYYSWGGRRMAWTLYYHHIISRPIETTIVVDEEMNRKYGEAE